MILLTLNILFMTAANICFWGTGNISMGLAFLGLQLFALVLQLLTRGEV